VTGGYTNLDDLRERMAAISLRRRKEGTVALPPKTTVRVPVTLAGRQLAMYQQMRDELAVWVKSLSGEEILAQGDNVLSRLIRLSQLASNPALLDAGYDEVPSKFITLDSLLSDALAPEASKVIVWTSFVPNIPQLLRRYEHLSPVALYGEMDGASRHGSVRGFKQDPRVRMLVANPAAAREGLTLTEAQTAIYLDRTFNLVDYLQSQDRIHRISQTKPCEILLLVARDSIDEYVDFALEQKQRLAQYTQRDTAAVTDTDLNLEKPDLLRALLGSAP
jgi:SWI/SNF-related matrix-associated actin-dependent regulator of chromatin subfamily A-like protein 1